MESQEKGDAGEKYVNELAYGSYLKYWCYPNPKDIAADNKEFCDLLILFRDIALIISVKNHHYDGDVPKYQKKVIEKSTNQLNGAYRKLFTSNRDIYVQHPDREPELFDPNAYQQVYRITINVGEQFENYSLGEHIQDKGFINILNKDTFDTIIGELDTINDLVDYLKKREDLLLAGFQLEEGCFEKDLLALFVTNNREFPVIAGNGGKLTILKCHGAWGAYQSGTAFAYKKAQDELSYFIDKMVRENILVLPDGERLARELMNTSRFERRMLSKDFHHLVNKYEGSPGDTLARRYHVFNNIGHLMMYYGADIPQEQIDEMVKLAAEVYAYHYSIKEVIVLAATDRLRQYKFGMFITSDNPHPEAIKRLDRFISQSGWFTNEKKLAYRETEFPEP